MGVGGWGVGGVGDWVGVSDGGGRSNSNRNLLENESEGESDQLKILKFCNFLLKKSTQPRKKLEFCMKN